MHVLWIFICFCARYIQLSQRKQDFLQFIDRSDADKMQPTTAQAWEGGHFAPAEAKALLYLVGQWHVHTAQRQGMQRQTSDTCVPEQVNCI
jgi:hypothetical protein